MILIAAIRIRSALLTSGELIMPCRRHGDGRRAFQELAPNVFEDARLNGIVEEGFLTDNGKFLNRVQAMRHAKRCGQLSQTTLWSIRDNKQKELYSEDLY